MLFGDAGSCVLHAEDHRLARRFRPKPYPSSRRGVAEGVGEQIGEHLKGPLPVGPYPRERARGPHLQGYLLGLEGGAETLPRLFQKRVGVQGLGVDLHGFGLHLGNQGEVPDQPAHGPHFLLDSLRCPLGFHDPVRQSLGVGLQGG